ncbi:hypothetical protein [Enterococcus wangshanyuanii]|nr:hypothetical protein [Enterococcus wangshanyuanii]
MKLDNVKLNEPDQYRLKNRNIFYDALHRGQIFSFFRDAGS